MVTLSTILIFCLVYLVMAVGRVPGTFVDRTTAALMGAVLLCLLHQHALTTAITFIDLNTLFALFVFMMMGVIAQHNGAMTQLIRPLMQQGLGGRSFLAVIMSLTGLLSMVMINDVVVVLLTPIVIICAQRLNHPLIPMLLGVALSSNLGSAASIVGNPQNLLLADAGGLHLYAYAKQTLLPVMLSLAGTWLIIVIVYRRQFNTKQLACDSQTLLTQAPELASSGSSTLVLLLLLGGFIGGMLVSTTFKVPLLLIVLLALLLLSKQPLSKVLPRIDWGVLILIAGLFVITGISASSLPLAHLPWLDTVLEQIVVSEPALIGASIIASNTIGNVPAVILLLSLPFEMSAQLATQLAYYTTVTGNLFLNGSLASIIVAEIARQHGQNLSFSAFLKVGVASVLLAVTFGLTLGDV